MQPEHRFGARWTDTYNRSIDVMRNQGLADMVFVNRPDGMYVKFARIGAAWLPQDNISDQLTEQVDAVGNTTGWVFTAANGDVRESYSALGRLESITSRSGMTETLTYSSPSTPTTTALIPGLLLSVIDSFGRAVTFSYDDRHRVVAVTDAAGGQYRYTYDAYSNLVSVTSPDAKVRTYHYGELANTSNIQLPHCLTGITDENTDRFATYKYDASERPIQSEHAGGVNKFVVSYPVPGTSSIVTDPLGTNSTSSFQTVLSEVKPTSTSSPVPGGGTRTESRTYDANGNLSSRTDYNDNKTCYAYDLIRNLETTRIEGLPAAAVCTTALAGTPALPARCTDTIWHPTFRLPATITEPTSAGSKVTTHTFDANGNVLTKSITVANTTRTATYTYDPFGRILTATDPRNNTTTNTYYPNDPAQGNNRGMLQSVTSAVGHTTTITSYSAFGQPLTITDANGLVTAMTYDARQRLTTRNVGGETTTYTYDGVGQLTSVAMPDTSSLTYTYDGAHRLTQIQDGLGNKVVYTLDNAGNRTKEDYLDPANALSRTRSRVYDALNRLQKDIGGATPASQITQYAYDANGNPTTTTDPLARVTTQSYDALNRLMQVVDPFNGTAAPTKYEYDAQDNLTKVTDPKNLATTYVYNGFNELTSQTSPDTGTTGFTYDNAGNMLTRTDARGVTATYSYDALNRVNTISYPAYQTDPAETVTYTYDTCTNGKGRLCSITDKTGTTTYSYDIKGRALGKAQTTLAVTQTIGYRYNAAGQMDQMTLPSGKLVAYTYVNNRIAGISYDGTPVVKNADYEPFGPLGEWTWGNDSIISPNKHTRYVDLDGRTTKIESGPANGSIAPTIIVYDVASRITDLQKLTAGVVDPAKSTSYGYDNLDRLTAVTPNAGNTNPVRGFSYDGVGNRLTSTITGSVTNYSYGTTSHRLNGLTGATTKTFGYDNDGNRTTDGTSTWSYGGNNRPMSIAIPATAVTIQAGINALGQRVTKTVNGAVTRFMYDEAGRLIGEYDAVGNPKQETLWFNDLPVAVIK